LKARIDWVTATFHGVSEREVIEDILLLNPNDFEQMDRGMYGYPFSLRMGNIVVLYGGRPEMGIHLSMTGAGCREYENIGRVPWSVRSVSCLRLKRNLRVWTSPWTTTSDTGQLKNR